MEVLTEGEAPNTSQSKKISKDHLRIVIGNRGEELIKSRSVSPSSVYSKHALMHMGTNDRHIVTPFVLGRF